MPRSSSRRTPKYRHHKASDQALIELNGHRHYLGAYGSPDSLRRYAELIAEWEAGGRQPLHKPADLTITELIARFWQHAEAYYRRGDGSPSSEVSCYRTALRPLRALYGDTLARDFGPRALLAVRQVMIGNRWCRSSINHQVGRLRRVFRWAVEQELIAESVLRSLQAVDGLRRGRSAARESKPVHGVPEPYIDAIEPHVARQVWAMVQLQLLTAARPGEVIIMRAIDLDTTGRIWLYSPAKHKTAHHGHRRTIYLGPRAQAIVEPFLSGPLGDFLFSPAEAEAERRAAVHGRRQTPIERGNRPGSNRARRPRRSPGRRYTVDSYRRAIHRGIEKANRAEAERAEEENRKPRLIPKWSPHQLRHTAATALRKEFGIETARVILGHRSAAMTEVYAELDHAKAVEVIARIG